MITKQVNEKLMEMIQAYGVDESLRGVHIGLGNENKSITQERFCRLKLDQIQTFLNNITQNQAEN